MVELRFGLKGEHPRTLAEVSSRFKREPGAHPPDRGQGPREDQGGARDPGHEGVDLRAGIAATPLTRILGHTHSRTRGRAARCALFCPGRFLWRPSIRLRQR